MALDPKKLTPAWQLSFEGAWTTAVTFLGSGDRLAAANREGELYIWDLTRPALERAEDAKDDEPPDLRPVRKLEAHTNGITHLLATRDGKQLVSSSLDHSVRIWPTDAQPAGTREVVLDIEAREREAKRRRDDSLLTAPGIEVELQTEHHMLPGHRDWVAALGISRDETRLISGDDTCTTIVWDLAQRKELARWTGHALDWVTSAALSPDGSIAFVAEYSSSRGSFDRPPAQVRFFEAASGKEQVDVLKVQFPKVKDRDNSYAYGTTWIKFVGRGFVGADFSPDGKLLAAVQGGEIGKAQVQLLEVETGKLVRSLAEHQSGATDVKFSADGKYLLSTGRDTTLQICQVADGKEVAKLGKPRGGQFKDWLSAVAISPDERRVAAADIAGKVHVWGN